MNQPSPYRPPAPAGDGQSPQRTRWRIIPAALFLIVGVLLILGSVIALVILGLAPAAARVSREMLLIAYAHSTLSGLSLVIASRRFWHGRWRYGIMMLVVAWALFAFGSMLGNGY